MSMQFSADKNVIWCHSIIDSIGYYAYFKLHPCNPMQKFSIKPVIDLSKLATLDRALYDKILCKYVNYMDQTLNQLTDPFNKWMFASRYVEVVTVNVLKEESLLCRPSLYYYESVLDIFCGIKIGLPFFADSLDILDWYKYASKCLLHLKDKEAVNKILSNLKPSSDPFNFNLDLLIVLWSFVLVINDPDDEKKYDHFMEVSSTFLCSIKEKGPSVEKALTIYLTFVNVFLEVYFEKTAGQATELTNFHKNIDVTTYIHKNIEPVEINFPQSKLKTLSDFVNKLFEATLSDKMDKIESLITPKNLATNQSINEMLAAIFELDEILYLLSKEITNLSIDLITFKPIKSITKIWEDNNDFGDVKQFQNEELFKLSRYFDSNSKESRYLVWLTLKHGSGKYLDILEKLECSIFLDPRVLHIFGVCLERFSNLEEYVIRDDLLLILEKVLKTITSRRRYSQFLSIRLKSHDLLEFGYLGKSRLPLLINRISCGNISYDNVKEEILFNVYISPLTFFERMICDCLEHRPNLLSFMVKLCCTELAPLCSSFVDPIKEITLITGILDNRLRVFSSLTTIESVMTFIKEVFLYYLHAKKPIVPVIMSLEGVIRTFAEDGSCDPDRSVRAKVAIFKLVRNLTNRENSTWHLTIENPAPLLYNLLQFIDYYWFDGSKKREIVELIEFVMNEKVQRLIALNELNWITSQITKNEEETLLISYLDSWIKEPIYDFYNVSDLCATEIFMLAAMLPNNHWLRRRISRVKIVGPSAVHDTAAILRFLCQKEWFNLFYFLAHYYSISIALSIMCEAVTAQEKVHTPLNSEYVTTCLITLVKTTWKRYKVIPSNIEPNQMPYPIFVQQLFRSVAMVLYSKELTRDDRLRLDDLLTEIATEMLEHKVDVYKAYVERRIMLHDTAFAILSRVYGPFDLDPKPKKPSFRPI